jgi:DNA mismatch repair protein MutL
MSLIKILPENLVNQIAAGEVVERPASVVKELVENSLDAGAKRIEITVEEGGKSLIQINDDGCGMSAEDLTMAIQRHATSKLQDEKGLWDVKTMGFRGEALASIASVARLSVKSKREADLAGAEILVEGGKAGEVREVGMSDGTQIEVRDLFFNTPARQKYLKKDSTELGHITSMLNAVALANPAVSFRLEHNGKEVVDLAACQGEEALLVRIGDLFGKATSEAMIPVFYGSSIFQIDGYVGKPLLSRSTSQHQYFLVNGRPIQQHLLANRVKAAYHSMLMEHKKPVFVINIKIDPSLIDVNVHPRKLEVRFEDQKAMISALYGAVKTSLEKECLIPKGFSESQRYMSDSVMRNENKFSAGPGTGNLTSSGGGFVNGKSPRGEPVRFPQQVSQQELSAAMNFSGKLSEKFSGEQASMDLDREAGGLEDAPEQRTLAIAQLSTCYIIAKKGEELILIDQHAGHERVRYEDLMREFGAKEKKKQQLLVPAQIELSKEEILLLEDNLELFEGLGFEIEAFGGGTYVVQAVPHCLTKQNIDEVIKGVLDDMQSSKKPSNMQGRIEEMLTYMSCRSAIKFGQKLSLDEMQSLLNQMAVLERPYTCPHGRPTMVKLTLDELGKMFGRK